MTRTRRNAWLWWLTPLIAFRLLVPLGYMVDTTGHGLSIVVCNSAIYKDGLVASGAHAHHHHDHGGQEDSSGHRDHDVCPFTGGANGTPALFHTPAAAAIVETALVVTPLQQSSIFATPGPLRSQQSRAPPRVS